MNPIVRCVGRLSRRARARRADVLKRYISLSSETKILDFGSDDGSNVSILIKGTEVRPENVYIADIDEAVVNEGHERFGFAPVHIRESGRLPFPDKFFDLVFCSSVIEHVTGPKVDVWEIRSGRGFRERSTRAQSEAAREILRLGKSCYVQTPFKWFPIESHTWLPFLGWLPRRVLVPLVRFINRTWVKRTQPDWHLLTRREMSSLFPDATIVTETFLGLPKSLVAITIDGTRAGEAHPRGAEPDGSARPGEKQSP
jgi:SAM-dependent methyltransferase